MARLLDTYDRILYLDTDIIVREDCPNLFDVVPCDQLGMFNEAPFTDRSRELLIDVCRQYDVVLPEWDGRYFNSGVMVISQAHRALFEKPETEVCNFYEQTYLNMRIAQLELPMFDLPYQFNRMTCMDRLTGEHRLASYIVHYAGALYFVSPAHMLTVITEDLRRWTQADGEFPTGRHIYVCVTGGLGDQICAEPAIRFMREQLYPHDEFVVATHWPRLFKHLTAMGVIVCEQGRANLAADTPYYLAESLPGPTTLQWRIVSHLMCHTVDYASMALMHRTLPVMERQQRFEVLPKDRAQLATVTGGTDLTEAVVVHPGRHWNSKTFPTAWWQAVIDGLVAAGHRVVLIGKNDPPSESGNRGTVDVSCPDGALDLRDGLALGMLGALFAQCRVVVSNDSAPVHLAGAFDPWIVLIPSCKHPDHILPYRHGSTQWKTTALYKRLVLDDVEARPTQVYQTSAEMPDIDWDEYLPDPAAVVAAVATAG